MYIGARQSPISSPSLNLVASEWADRAPAVYRRRPRARFRPRKAKIPR